MEMTVIEAIKKFNLSINPVNKTQIKCSFDGRLTEKDSIWIRGNKPAIMEELKRQELQKQQQNMLYEKTAMEAEIIGFTFTAGCDCPDTYGFIYNIPADFPYDFIYKRKEADKKLCNIISGIIKNDKSFVEQVGFTIIAPANKSYYGYDFDAIQVRTLIIVAQNIINQKIINEQDNAKNEEKRIKELFMKAHETGEKQMIRRHTSDCVEKSIECSLDIITEYAMPDGSIKEERIHSY
jgi:hypothetical protein